MIVIFYASLTSNILLTYMIPTCRQKVGVMTQGEKIINWSMAWSRFLSAALLCEVLHSLSFEEEKKNPH